MTVADRLRAATRPGWFDRALCAVEGVPVDVFFPDLGQPGDQARQFCDRCPVRAECLAYGLGEQHGIWGGRSAKQRRMIRRNLR